MKLPREVSRQDGIPADCEDFAGSDVKLRRHECVRRKVDGRAPFAPWNSKGHPRLFRGLLSRLEEQAG